MHLGMLLGRGGHGACSELKHSTTTGVVAPGREHVIDVAIRDDMVVVTEDGSGI